MWKLRSHRDNHFLDCRIGNTALANAYFVGLTAEDWARIARERGVPQDLIAPDLFNPLSRVAAPASAAANPAHVQDLPPQSDEAEMAASTAAENPEQAQITPPPPPPRRRDYWDGLAEVNRGV